MAYTIDMSQLKPLMAEFRARVAQLGTAEAERRIGRRIDQRLTGDFVTLSDKSPGDVYRALPTPELERVLVALWA